MAEAEFSTEINKMKVSYSFALLFLPLALSQCPETGDISPCKCTEEGDQRRLSCWGNIELLRLTNILRDAMCGRTVDKFELLGTNITYLPSNLFSRMTVNDINIYSTRIQRLSADGQSAFRGLEDNLNSLSMRRCFLKDHLQWQVFSQMYNLSYLDLSYNELTQIPAQWMDHPPPNVRSLLLKGNKISTLEPNSLKWMYSLVELDLSENSITSLSREALPLNGNSLILLRLSYNMLENIDKGSFDGMFSLRRIYLDNNNFTKLDESTWRPIWGDLEALDLNGNNILCDQDALWMAELRSPARLYGECSGSNLQNTHLRTLTIDDFDV